MPLSAYQFRHDMPFAAHKSITFRQIMPDGALVSDNADFITGSDLPVDGGVLALLQSG